MTTVTLIIAVLGLVLSTASLIWQGANYRLMGPRLKLKLVRGLRGPRGLLVASLDTQHDAYAAEHGYTEALLGVEVTNVGRMPITITRALATLNSTGLAVVAQPSGIDPDNNYRLDPHSATTWWADLTILRMMVIDKSQPKPVWTRPHEVRMVVSASGQKDRETKECFTIAP